MKIILLLSSFCVGWLCWVNILAYSQTQSLINLFFIAFFAAFSLGLLILSVINE